MRPEGGGGGVIQSADLILQVGEATERLVATIAGVDEDQLQGPSLLPGWTRAHLLTHIARNADAVRNLLLGVRSGRRVRMYPSTAARAADIEAGAGRPAGVILADAVESSRRFLIDAECMPPDRWDGEFSFEAGPDTTSLPSGRVLEMRLREVELHHVDLDAGYLFTASPGPLVEWLLDDAIRRLGRQGVTVRHPAPPAGSPWTVEVDGVETPVSGDPAEMLAWLSGRSPGAALDSPGPLPALPSLG